MKTHRLLLLLIVFALAVLAACGNAPLSDSLEPFPYKDLSEEAYIQNATAYWDELSAYLDASEAESLAEALEAHSQERGEPAPEDSGSMDMIMRYNDYLLEQSGETPESIAAMPEAKKNALVEEGQKRMAEDIPNAIAVQEAATEKKERGEGIVGSLRYKDQQSLAVFEDGTMVVSA